MKLDWTKPIQTRGGRKARLLGRLRNDDYPMVVAMEIAKGSDKENLYMYLEDGRLHSMDHIAEFDIINVPQKMTFTFFFNVYDDPGRGEPTWEMALTKANAETLARKHGLTRIACKSVTFDVTQGEGL